MKKQAKILMGLSAIAVVGGAFALRHADTRNLQAAGTIGAVSKLDQAQIEDKDVVLGAKGGAGSTAAVGGRQGSLGSGADSTPMTQTEFLTAVSGAFEAIEKDKTVLASTLKAGKSESNAGSDPASGPGFLSDSGSDDRSKPGGKAIPKGLPTSGETPAAALAKLVTDLKALDALFTQNPKLAEPIAKDMEASEESLGTRKGTKASGGSGSKTATPTDPVQAQEALITTLIAQAQGLDLSSGKQKLSTMQVLNKLTATVANMERGFTVFDKGKNPLRSTQPSTYSWNVATKKTVPPKP